MGIELGALEIPMQATGRDAVLRAMADVDRAAAKAAAPVTIPVRTRGAAEAAASLEVLHQIQGRVADRLRAMGVAEQDVQAALERSGPAIQKVVEQSGQLHAIREALIAQNRRVGSSDEYGVGLDAITKRITLLKQGLQVEQTRAASLTKLQAAEQQLGLALTRQNLTLKEQINLGVQLQRVKTTLAEASSREVQAVDAVAAGMAKATTGATAWAAGIAAVSEQQRQAAATALHLATANDRLIAGMSAAGRAGHAASAGSRAWATGLATLRAQQAGAAAGATAASGVVASGMKRITSAVGQVAVVALSTRSAVAGLVTGGLMTMGASTAVILGVVAAAALIAVAWERLTRQARETKEAVQELREELNKPTRQDKALEGVQLLTTALAESERRLAQIKQGEVVPTEAGTFEVLIDPAKVAKAQKVVDDLRADLKKATQAVSEIRQEAAAEETAVLVKAIELRTASAEQIRVATERLRLLDAVAKDETKTLAQQNAAQEEANQLRAAFKKLADEEADGLKKIADARKEELDSLAKLASETDLTAGQVAILVERYDEATKALQAKNLTDAEQVRLLEEQRKALLGLQAAGARSSETRTTKGSTFGQDLGLGARAKTPSLDNLTFGADQDTTSTFFAGDALEGFTSDLDRQAKQAINRVKSAVETVEAELDASIDQLHTTIAAGLATSIADGITEGFEQGIASGSLGRGAQVLVAHLLSGLGDAAISFGLASLGIAKLMAKIKAALSSLNPAVAIPAAIGLIALGAALKGAASAMFGDGSGGGGGGSAATAAPQGSRITVGAGGEITNREPIEGTSRVQAPATDRLRAQSSGPEAPIPSARPVITISPAITVQAPAVQRVAQQTAITAAPRFTPAGVVAAPATAARENGRVDPARVIVQQHFTLLGAPDTRVQRFISDASNEGAQRGLKFGVARRG